MIKSNTTSFLKYLIIVLFALFAGIVIPPVLNHLLFVQNTLKIGGNNPLLVFFQTHRVISIFVLSLLPLLPLLLIKPKESEYDTISQLVAWKNSSKGPRSIFFFTVISSYLITGISIITYFISPFLFSLIEGSENWELFALIPVIGLMILTTGVTAIILVRYYLFNEILTSTRPWRMTFFLLITIALTFVFALFAELSFSENYIINPALEEFHKNNPVEQESNKGDIVVIPKSTTPAKVKEFPETSGQNLYINSKFNFQMNLNPDERMVECEDQNGLVAWVTTNPPVDKDQVNECATESEWESVMVSNLYPSTDVYQQSLIDLEFQIQAEPTFVGNINSLHLHGVRPPTASPYPGAGEIDVVSFMNRNQLYVIPYTYLARDFRLINE